MIQTNNIIDSFAKDIALGLSDNPKYLSSKYFYNTEGDKLFQKIMAMPEYYLTNAEDEILSKQSNLIRKSFGNQPIDIIELGAGDGSKTKHLLNNLIEHKVEVRYIPSDISPNILEELKSNLSKEIPSLEVIPLTGDYFKSLVELPDCKDRKRVMLYLGANIGNLERKEASNFLRQLQQFLKKGDQIMIGFDLKKNPQTILDAYNDAQGFTAAFNLNLLKRINEELGGNFDTDAFTHWERYNPETGSARSYLVSKRKQSVTIEALETTFTFEPWETIRMELSQKYSQSDIEQLSTSAGYKVVQHFFDSKKYFVDSLWEY